jgi:hypothetical protein
LTVGKHSIAVIEYRGVMDGLGKLSHLIWGESGFAPFPTSEPEEPIARQSGEDGRCEGALETSKTLDAKICQWLAYFPSLLPSTETLEQSAGHPPQAGAVSQVALG